MWVCVKGHRVAMLDVCVVGVGVAATLPAPGCALAGQDPAPKPSSVAGFEA